MAAHPHKRLTPVAIKHKSTPGRYADGNGLYLVVDGNGKKRWLLRVVVQGRRRDMGLGSATLVSLAEARDLAVQYRKQARSGEDPLLKRRQLTRALPTFEQAARLVHIRNRPSWKNPKHAAQWISTLEQYVFPVFGSIAIDQIHTAHVLEALSPIWLTKSETARRVRQRIGTVMDWAKAAGYRSGDNPIDGVAKGLPKQTDLDVHHAALAYAELPAFVRRLREFAASEPIRFGLEFLILTATRTSEVILATWGEIDLANKVWIVPAARMKGRKQHRVPLAPRAVQILEEAAGHRQGQYVFPGMAVGKPLSSMAFLMLLRRMGQPVTAHGFRSTFRDWAAERTHYPREVCEAALAHRVENQVEAAYRRSDLFDLRRELMNAWAEFATERTQRQSLDGRSRRKGGSSQLT